ncbi:hypothetical protein [Nonomuraea polychroma]|uniref:hypothetical protein n=1 Tax=Nonomuraea polychroma TaxID=46176 RepID=UPI0013E31C36|nr:hypothetical protein [Nonomuraea polychroma]
MPARGVEVSGDGGAGRVGFGGDARGGLLPQAYVAAEAGQVLVAALVLQFGRGATSLGQML